MSTEVARLYRKKYFANQYNTTSIGDADQVYVNGDYLAFKSTYWVKVVVYTKLMLIRIHGITRKSEVFPDLKYIELRLSSVYQWYGVRQIYILKWIFLENH